MLNAATPTASIPKTAHTVLEGCICHTAAPSSCTCLLLFACKQTGKRNKTRSKHCTDARSQNPMVRNCCARGQGSPNILGQLVWRRWGWACCMACMAMVMEVTDIHIDLTARQCGRGGIEHVHCLRIHTADTSGGYRYSWLTWSPPCETMPARQQTDSAANPAQSAALHGQSYSLQQATAM